MEYPAYVRRFSSAIANAEGENKAGSVPQRQNNPGDLVGPGGIKTFPTVQAGWDALYKQVQMMFDGSSAYYDPTMSISDIAYLYANGANDPQGASNWASNVASYLGVTTDTTLEQLMG